MRSRRKHTSHEADWLGLFWFRFGVELPVTFAKRRRIRDLLRNNFASLSFGVPCSHREIVESIGANAQIPIPIDYLCSELDNTIVSAGKVVFGSPGKYFDEIAMNYSDLYWWLSEKGLRMEVVKDNRRVSFDDFAGHLMSEARCNRGTKYLSQNDYLVIADQLDKAGFLLRDHLQGKYRKVLALWNQKRPGETIKTFREAIQSEEVPKLRRGVLRSLYYAESKYRNGAAAASGFVHY
jgi:hypothetical protein